MEFVEEFHVQLPKAPGVGRIGQSANFSRQKLQSVPQGGVGRVRAKDPQKLGQFHSQLIGLFQRLDVDIGDKGPDTMHRLQQAFAFQPDQNPPQGCAAGPELCCQILL